MCRLIGPLNVVQCGVSDLMAATKTHAHANIGKRYAVCSAECDNF